MVHSVKKGLTPSGEDGGEELIVKGIKKGDEEPDGFGWSENSLSPSGGGDHFGEGNRVRT